MIKHQQTLSIHNLKNNWVLFKKKEDLNKKRTEKLDLTRCKRVLLLKKSWRKRVQWGKTRKEVLKKKNKKSHLLILFLW